MKHVLIIYAKNTSEILNRKSAIGSYIFSLAGLLNDKQHQLYINGIRFEDLSMNESTSSLKQSVPGGLRKYIPPFLKSLRRERTAIQHAQILTDQILNSSFKYDHILEFYTLGSSAGAQISQKKKCPLTLVYDNPVIEEYTFFYGKPALPKKLIRLERLSVLQANQLVTYSKPVADDLIKRHPGIKASVYHHQNIDFSRFEFQRDTNKPANTLNICFVGSFLKWHNTDLLVRSFDRLSKASPEKKMELYMVGDGMMRQHCEQLAAQLNNLHIHFTGFLDGRSLIDLQKQMHIGVMPGSNWYGAPNKIFEYGAMGMACIAPDTATIGALFSKKQLEFFTNNDPDSFYKALKKLVTDDTFRKELAANLREFVGETYGEDKTRHFYSKLLSLL